MKDEIINTFEYEILTNLLEEERPSYQGKLESFDLYSARIKSEIIKNRNEYYHQLFNGYRLILEKLKNN